MKRTMPIGRWSPAPSAIAVLLGALAIPGAVMQAFAQGSPAQAIPVFEGSRTPSPEEAALEKQRQEAPATPQRARPSVQELVDQIGRQAGGREKLERAKAGGKPDQVIAAADRAAPEAAELERQKPPAPPKSARPSRKELEEAIGAQAGGREKLERARQGGRPDRAPPQASLSERAATWLASLPSVITPAHAAGELSITLTPTTNAQGSHAGLYSSQSTPSGNMSATAYVYGPYVSNWAPNNTFAYAYTWTRNWDGTTTSRNERPYVYLYVYVPKESYYIVNTRASTGAGVQLRRYSAGTYPIVQTFDASGLADRPALVYLTAGGHTFYWVFPSYFYFYSASVDSYP